MAGPADTYLAQHPELFRNKGATTKNQRYDNVAQKKYGSKSTSVLPPEFTQEQLEQMYVQSRRNGTPWNGPVPNIALARQLEQVYGQDPNLARPLMQSVNANPISDNKQTQDARQPEPEKMGTKGPDTYNKAQGLVKDAQDKAGIAQSSEYNQAKRAQEDAARALDNAKGFEHIAKYTPNQNPAEVKAAEDEKNKVKAAVDQPKEEPKEPQQPAEPAEEKEQEPSKVTEDTTSPGEPKWKGLSDTFYRDINAMFQGKPTGNVYDVDTAANKDQARNWRASAANRDMEAQASQQIANQNPYAEAGKTATVQNDAQNRQNVQKSGVLGAGAALARTTTTPDVATEKARVDTQRNVAAQQREKADEMHREATDAERIAAEHNVYSRDFDNWTNESGYLNRGGNVNDSPNQPGLFDNIKEWWNNAFPKKETNPRFQTSDERVKDIVAEYAKGVDDRLAEARMKWIREDYENDGLPCREDMDWLLTRAGKLNHNGREYDIMNEDSWDDNPDPSVLSAYADHIKNYVYNYKPEAQEIDSSINPNEEHIGPMAQDIEQVNPACIKETPEGVKTVDTARLSMMNAGAIGDLARELRSISERLEKIGV